MRTHPQKINNLFKWNAPNWLRLLFPVLLGSLIITLVVKTMYFGGRRESLAAQAESTMIRWALTFASSPSSNETRVTTISVNDDDLLVLEKAPSAQLIDAHIREYAAVLDQVAQSKPQWVVLSWLTYAHPITPEYLQPLTAIIDKNNLRDRVTLAVNLYASGTIPPDFVAKYNIIEARDCYYDINSFCTFSPEWTWMPQQVMNRFFQQKPAWVISKNLPHTLPNLLLNLPTSTSLKHHSFLDLRPPGRADIGNGSIVFIGNDTSQALSFRDNKDAIQKTFIASSTNRRTLLKDGIPWHSFWAAMTSMFIEQRTLAVAPAGVTRTVIGIVILAILVAIRVMGGLALAPFLIAALMMPVINMIGVKYFYLYIPAMDMIIAGLVVFTAATFISVAFSSYSKWRLTAAEEVAEATADIKENFIHLISHNLNTPIAQLRGLMDILDSSAVDNSGMTKASQELEYVRVISQCVLTTSSLTSVPAQEKEHSIRSFVQEFIENDTEFFRRTATGIEFTPPFTGDETGEIWFYKLIFDRAVVSRIILYASILLTLRERATRINIDFSPVNDEPADPRGLVVRISAIASDNLAHLDDSDFCLMALNRYLSTAEQLKFVTMRRAENIVFLTFPQSQS